MPPINSTLNHTYSHRVYIEHLGDYRSLGSIFKHLPYVMHIIVRQLGSGMFGSLVGYISTLIISILVVVYPCSKKEVIWVYTNPIVAPVTNTHSFSDYAEINIINDSANTKLKPDHFVVKSNCGISVPGFRASPIPAFIRCAFYNFGFAPSLDLVYPKDCNGLKYIFHSSIVAKCGTLVNILELA